MTVSTPNDGEPGSDERSSRAGSALGGDEFVAWTDGGDAIEEHSLPPSRLPGDEFVASFAEIDIANAGHELLDAAEPYLQLADGPAYQPDELIARERRWWLAARLADPTRIHELRMLLRPEGAAMDEALDSGPAPATRGELRELAAALGIERADEVAAGALVGLALQRDLSGGARSHLGGAPSLPADLSWPYVRDEDRPITFMASIDCAELPDADGRELLPADGTLLFFADTAFGGAVHEGWGEPGTGGRIRVHHIPAGTEVETVPPPAVLAEPDDEYGSTQVLERVPVIARPVLTLPEPWLVESRFALTAGESAAYVRLWERCSSALDDPAGREGLTSHHQILGHPESIQDDPRQGDQVLLLLIRSDAATGLEYQDGGCVYYLAEPDDLRSGHFDRVIGADASH